MTELRLRIYNAAGEQKRKKKKQPKAASSTAASLCSTEAAKRALTANTPSNLGCLSSARFSLSTDGFLCCVECELWRGREGGCVGGGAGSLHCVRTADSARTTAPSISVMGTPVQCITLITLASAFSAARKKKKNLLAAADGQQAARSASPSSISNQERAGKCLPRRRDKERGGASVGSHYRQRV